MRLFDLITPYEDEMLDAYRKSFSGRVDSNEEYCDNKTFLAEWEAAKGSNPVIAEIFKSNLKFSKEIIVTKTPSLLEEEINYLLFESGIKEVEEFVGNLSKGFKELSKYITLIVSHGEERTTFSYVGLRNSFVRSSYLAANRYNSNISKIVFDNGKSLTLPKGSKHLKMIKNLCEFIVKNGYDTEGRFVKVLENYEAFRIEHSKILNQKLLKGKLTISIHPLDYITMSDNYSGWSSCMSWLDDGEYRAGTLEMMNSKDAIVAYLESETTPFCFGDYKWNNKKWREIFVLNPDLAIGVKGYPFTNEELETEVLKMVNELSNNHYSHEASYDTVATRIRVADRNWNIQCHFHTNLMYNDFYNLPEGELYKIAQVSESFFEVIDKYTLNYSGKPTCIFCGRLMINEDDSYALRCGKCSPPIGYCLECGKPIYFTDPRYPAVGYSTSGYVCHYCSNDLLRDLQTGRFMPKYADNFEIYVFEDGLVEESETVKDFPEAKSLKKGYLLSEFEYNLSEVIEKIGRFLTPELRIIENLSKRVICDRYILLNKKDLLRNWLCWY